MRRALVLGLIGWYALGPGGPALAVTEGERAQVFVAPFRYELTGMVAAAGPSEVQIDRQGEPRATLRMIEGRTKVLLNGKSVPTMDLQEGMRVTARFQLAGDEIIATEIFANAGQAAPAPAP